MRELIYKWWLPQCLALKEPIPYELFWKLNPKKLEPFFEADKIRYKQEQEMLNLTAWLNGLYVTHAIGACFSKNSKYPPQPIDMAGKNKFTLKQKAELWALYMNEDYYSKHPEERPV
jgi:hypothetical protein